MKKFNHHRQLSEHRNVSVKEVCEENGLLKSCNNNLETLYKSRLISPISAQVEYFNFFAGGKALNSPMRSSKALITP